MDSINDETAGTEVAPLPRMTEEQLGEARVKISGYLDEAEANGIKLRAITGQMMRLAKQAGLDLVRLGSDLDEMDDEEYYDQLVLAGWLLSAEPAKVVTICQACGFHGDQEALKSEASEWALKELDSIVREEALTRAFIARWLEYRIEIQALTQRSDELPSDTATQGRGDPGAE